MGLTLNRYRLRGAAPVRQLHSRRSAASRQLLGEGFRPESHQALAVVHRTCAWLWPQMEGFEI